MLEAVVAVYSNWGIGFQGTQPVSIHADRRHFRSLTEGRAVVVGRRTLQDFPGGKPLKNREHFILSRNLSLNVPGATVLHNVQDVLTLADTRQVFVIGGEEVYTSLFPYLVKVYVTYIDEAVTSDTFFPDLEREPVWQKISAEPWQEEDGHRFQYRTYEKVTL